MKEGKWCLKSIVVFWMKYSAGLDDAFDVRPKADLEVRRVPEFKEEGSAGAYYNQPAMDGSRGGLFYANLRNVHESVKFGMKTLAYHEGIPGHHFQIAIQSELKGVPIFRTIGLFHRLCRGVGPFMLSD